ncbi:hypothetical protein M0R45_024011 [Rubus argutus]|uniref:Transcription initiation factor IIA subunit 2 n=1 Tax=Rubus argutus TaxID=59490 RepID=A0AAW1WRS8_RUBAR
MATLYMGSRIGVCLTEALEKMIEDRTLSAELAYQVLLQFDRSMAKALETRVRNKVTIKGHLHTYQYYEDVWKFVVCGAVVRFQNSNGITVEENVDHLKIVACDSKHF